MLLDHHSLWLANPNPVGGPQRVMVTLIGKEATMPMFNPGQEWQDRGGGNYIIINVEEAPLWDDNTGGTVEYVTTFDWEGVIDRMPAVVWAELIVELGCTEETESSLKDRLASWREMHPDNFPLGIPTGRKFIYDSDNGLLLHYPLAKGESLDGVDNWAIWDEEIGTDDGTLWYRSDHEDYALNAEEFGAIEECGLCGKYLIDGRCPEEDPDAPSDDTPFGRGGDWCPWCGADWKAEHDADCPRPKED